MDPACPMCGLAHEDTMHTLVMCDFTQLVWHESHLPLSNIMGNNFIMWFTNILTTLTEDEICMDVAILYHVWRARNNVVWDNFIPAPKRVVASAAATLQAWRAVNYRLLSALEWVKQGAVYLLFLCWFIH